MTYRRPAVTVIQEFLASAPALSAVQLPNLVIGPAYQLVNNQLFGNYIGNEAEYAYAGKMQGSVVDTEALAEDEMFPAIKKPISLQLKNALVKISEGVSGVCSNTLFTDLATNAFSEAVAGDKVRVLSKLAVEIIEEQTDGASVSTPGLRNRLQAGTAGLFSNVKVGDTVTITAGTNTVLGDFVIDVKISNDSVRVIGDINDGGGNASDITFSVNGDRGNVNMGDYRIKSKTDNNNLVLESPFAESESIVSYEIIRSYSTINLTRDAHFTVDLDKVTVLTGINYLGKEVISGSLYGSYRSLRNDLSARVKDFAGANDVIAYFGGADQVNPANPLAYALSIKAANTTTKVNGLALDENAVSNELLSYNKALDIAKLTDMYAISVMTSNTVIHQALRTHVNGLSLTDKERVGLVSRILITKELLVEEEEIDDAIVGARVIVNTQVDGTMSFSGNPKEVNDSTSDQFLNVRRGDKLVVVGGLNSIPGTYTVEAITNNNKLVLNANACTGDVANLEYYIVRQDGLGSDGITFYDRNASFIEQGVTSGCFIKFLSGSIEGTYKVTGVANNKTISIEQIPGIVTLTTGMTYQIYRELSKTEQAEIMAGYSSAMASRRIVNIWPDVLKAPIGAEVVNLPGYFGACAIGAIVTGLPPQQGLTNFSISGFIGLEHSTGYFDDEQLDIIAAGGTLILIQEVEDQPLVIRHQLTTDRSTIKFQELSITKNVDYISKFIRTTYKPMPGRYNVVDSAFDDIKTTAAGIVKFLKDETKLPRIGGVIRGGSLSSLEEDPTQIDTIKGTFDLSIPVPLNNLIFTIRV